MTAGNRNASKLGFGMMRLPEKDGEPDLKTICRMADAFFEGDMNYIDTAYVYHRGKSETAVGEAVVKRYPRDCFLLATKLPIWEMKGKEDRDRIFSEQLERTGAGYFDYYLLHSVEDGNIEKYEGLDCFGWGQRAEQPRAAEPEPEAVRPEGDEAVIARLLEVEDLTFGDIARSTGMEAGPLATTLTMMEVKGLIHALPGNMYRIVR